MQPWVARLAVYREFDGKKLKLCCPTRESRIVFHSLNISSTTTPSDKKQAIRNNNNIKISIYV